MIERIIYFSIKNKIIVGLCIAALIGWGTYSITKLPIDAVPDITNNQVQVIAVAPSLAAQEVESFITMPVEVAVATISKVVELRSISRLGLSVVTVVFEDDVDIFWARQQISERLRDAEKQIPQGVADINMAPVSTGLGEIFQYTLEVEKGYEEKYPLMELRTLQDWVVRRQMLGTPGVAEVNSYGGFVKQYEIAVNPERLRSMNLSLSDVFTALEKNNENTGSAYLDKKPNAYFIRGIGLATSLEDIGNILIKTSSQGMPILIRDIGTVQFGHAARYGALVEDTTEAVGGVVMMLKGANASRVVADVKQKIETIQKSMPEGVTIRSYLDRTDLVNRTIGTVTLNLTEGALIVIFILVLLLGNMRAGMIVASVIPLSMLFAVSMMNLFGISGNLMSLGAIDFGLIVDGAVIIVESVVHRLYQTHQQHSDLKRISQSRMDENVHYSTKRMMSSATFGQVIILIVYLPIVTLIGIEGKMFKPMAQVVAFAIIGATILSLTWIPMASALFLSKKTVYKPSLSDRLMDWIHKAFHPVIIFAFRRKTLLLAASVVLFIFSLFIFSRLGGEFIPQLEEGDLAAGIVTLQGGSLSNTVETVEKANKILLENFPEIKHTICKIGAGEIPTDPTPMETGDYIITLKDKKEWTSAKTRSELVEKMEEKLSVLAGVKFEFQQPIQMRFNELMSGSKQDVAIKVFGDNLETIALHTADIEKILRPIEGIEDINVEKITGLSQIQVHLSRERIAQYGLSVSEVNRVLKTAFAGSSAGVIYNEERRFDMVVRLGSNFRQSIDDVKNLSVELPSGQQVPLDQLAEIEIKSGPAQVSRENTKRRISVGFNVRNRDVETVIKEVRSQIDARIKLPEGYYITYGGQFENLVAARERLSIAVPLALILIFVLLFFTFQSVKQALLIYSAVPLAAIGGVLALWARDMNFSISAGVGFIALFGVAVLNGIVLISEFNRLEKSGMTNIHKRVLKGLKTRLRPVLMTAGVASLGFLPMALSTSAGAEVQKPLSTVVIGGLITSTFLTLIVLPTLYIVFSNRKYMPKLRKTRVVAGILFMAGILLSSGLQAQTAKKVTLQEALKTVLDSNLSVQSAVYGVDYQKAIKKGAWDLGKTSFDMEYGQINSYRNDNNFSVKQSFAFPSLYIHQTKLARANISNSEWRLKIKQLEMTSMTKTVYWQLVYLYSKQKLLVYQDSIFSGFSRAAQRKAETGETNRLEMITARSQSLEIKNQLQQTQADISIQTRKFRNLLNTLQPVMPEDTILRKLEFSIPSDSAVTGKNPELGLAINQINASQLEKKVERSRLMPEFTVGYFNQSIIGNQDVNGSPWNYKSSDRFTGIQAGISIPIWGLPYVSKVKGAQIGEKIARTNAANVEKNLENTYQSLLDEFNKYQSSVDYYEKQALPEAQMIIVQSEKSYKAGALDYLEYIQSLNRALAIQQAYLVTLQNFNQTVISLDYITGKIL